MEEKKNNAVEKTEKAIKQASEKGKPKKHGAKKKVSTAQKKRTATTKTVERENKQKLRAEREKIRAEKRVELARIKAHKKAEKEKAQATALRERARKKAELKQRRAELKKQRVEQREKLMHESKVERERRIAEERANAMRIKQERHDRRMELKKQKLAERRAKNERVARDRQRNKERRHGTGGWLAAVISLGVASLILSSVLTFVLLTPSVNDGVLESTYRKSFYDTVEQVDNIDLNLSKVLATSDTGAIQRYLVDTAINSELCENDLQQLPLQDESKYYTTKLINQIGDYSKYLNNKLIAGEKLSESDIEGLTRLYNANRTFKESLQLMASEMGTDYSFSSLANADESNLVIKNFNELQNLSVEYPELIYDGPFSDGLDGREIKGLQGETISAERARDIFASLFGRFSLEEVESVGETSSGIECYNVQAKADGELLYAQISKLGGKLIMFDYAGDCNGVNHDAVTAIETAQGFLNTLEIKDMEAVWINLSNNVYTINFAYTQKDVTVYSDLIKIRICADTNKVLGFEGTGYYTNHAERLIGKPVLSQAEAQSKVSKNIEVESSRLALVPIGNSSEKLCYEFSGEYDGSTYYIYIDAITGRQVEMFKVIESTEGELLM